MFLKHRRQQVLAGVLLHVVEAARPIDKTFYCNALEPAVNNVNDFLLAVAYLQNLRIAKLPEVVRLTARSRIKGRLIQDCLPGGGLDPRGRRNGGGLTTQDSSDKFSLEGIVVIKPACCHGGRCASPSDTNTLSACGLMEPSLTSSLESLLPCLRVFVPCSGVEQHHRLMRLDPPGPRKDARPYHGGSSFRRRQEAFERRQFPSRVQHLVIRRRHGRSLGLPQHAENQLISERPRHAQPGSNGRRVWEELCRTLMCFPGLHDGRTAFCLHRYHARPLCTDPPHLLEFVERLAHPDQTHAPSRGVKNDMRQLPVKLLPQLVAHGFLAFHAIGLFQRGDVVPSFAVFVLRYVFSAFRNQAIELHHLGAKRLALHHVR